MSVFCDDSVGDGDKVGGRTKEKNRKDMNGGGITERKNMKLEVVV
jgi:hypothetical protein